MTLDATKLNLKPGLTSSSQRAAVNNNRISLASTSESGRSSSSGGTRRAVADNLSGRTRSSVFGARQGTGGFLNRPTAVAYSASYGVGAVRSFNPAKAQVSYAAIRNDLNGGRSQQFAAMYDNNYGSYANMQGCNGGDNMTSMEKLALLSGFMGQVFGQVGQINNSGSSERTSGEAKTGEKKDPIDTSNLTTTQALQGSVKSAKTSASAASTAAKCQESIDKAKDTVEDIKLGDTLKSVQGVENLDSLKSEFGLEAKLDISKIKDLNAGTVTTEELKEQAGVARDCSNGALKGMTTLSKAVANCKELIGTYEGKTSILEGKLSAAEAKQPVDTALVSQIKTELQKYEKQIEELTAKQQRAEAGIETLQGIKTECDIAVKSLSDSAKEIETLEETKKEAEAKQVELAKAEDKKLSNINKEMSSLVAKLNESIGTEKTIGKHDKEDSSFDKSLVKLKGLQAEHNELMDLVTLNSIDGAAPASLTTAKSVKSEVDQLLNNNKGRDVDVDEYNRRAENEPDKPKDSGGGTFQDTPVTSSIDPFAQRA